MEIFELRYFLAVARNENIHRASENLNVSPGSLSKAVSRLEHELGVSLFYKRGRNIRLTPEGVALKIRAAHIVQFEEDTKIELSGKRGSINITISAEEILHSHFGIDFSEVILSVFPQAKIQFLTKKEDKVAQQVFDGEAHFGILTSEVPKHLVWKPLSAVDFKTCASSRHPLFKKNGASSKIPIEEILKFPFVSPDSALLGRVGSTASQDGWRDDKFPREIQYRVSSLKTIEKLVQRGRALAYLPDYFIKELNLHSINVIGCRHSCRQSVKLICRDPKALGWMNRIWEKI